MADPFARWYAERHGREPDHEAVEALAEEWLEGMLPGTEHAVSPHRTEYFRELISDWQDDPIADAALALLPDWVRWNGQQAGLPAPLIERAVSAASASPDQPACRRRFVSGRCETPGYGHSQQPSGHRA